MGAEMVAEITPELIQSKYDELGLTKGWTFLACDERRLRDAQVAFVGTNPGGGGEGDDYAYQGIWSCQENAFCSEPSNMQGQLQAWHRVLNVQPELTLCAQFIPFRSPDLQRLGRQQEAVAFARDVWRWVLDVSPAALFVTMGALPAENLARLLDARLIVQGLPTGWGKMTIDVWEAPSGRRVVRMPHPSRYSLLDRANGASAVAEASLRMAAGLD